jgi:hypothetical protein
MSRSDAYGAAALERASAAIVAAPRGGQERTLHREAYAIGGLVAGGVIDEGEARRRLIDAARSMPTFGERWIGLDRKVATSLRRGMAAPRTPVRAPTLKAAPIIPPKAEGTPSVIGGTTTASAIRLFREAVDPRGTSAERYFRSRALDLPVDLCGRVLRWHEGAGAMLALFRDVQSGEPRAVSRTFLDGDARKIERRFLGPVANAAIMLDPFDCVLGGLHIGEGLETCLAARQWDLRPVWALGSAGAIERFPVLGGVEVLTICGEHDVANARAVEACGRRWRQAGREVRIIRALAGKDLNDAAIARRDGRA